MNDLKTKALQSVKWNLINQIQIFIFKFTIGVIIARLLSPEEFGLVGLVLIFSDFAYIFIDGGLNASLIQKQKVTNEDYEVIFTYNIVIGLISSISFFLLSDYFGIFFKDNRLGLITKVFSVVFLMNSITVVHRSKLSREMNFKKQTIIQTISTFSSGSL